MYSFWSHNSFQTYIYTSGSEYRIYGTTWVHICISTRNQWVYKPRLPDTSLNIDQRNPRQRKELRGREVNQKQSWEQTPSKHTVYIWRCIHIYRHTNTYYIVRMLLDFKTISGSASASQWEKWPSDWTQTSESLFNYIWANVVDIWSYSVPQSSTSSTVRELLRLGKHFFVCINLPYGFII